VKRSIVLLVPCVLLVCFVNAGPARSESPDLASLERALEKARTPADTERALDALTDRIGKTPGFRDAGAFGDWLGSRRGVSERPRVMLRRGWAYLAAGRPGAAKPLLEAVHRRGGEASGVALAYLGETARQDGDLGRALELLTQAAREGYRDTFVMESAQKAAFQMRTGTPSKTFDGLPDYVEAGHRFFAVYPHTTFQGAVARWLLDDYGAYARPGAERARTWARAAAELALPALRDAATSGADARLAFDAAQALAPEDDETRGRTLRWALMAWAYRLGNRPDEDTHDIPQAIVRLAELAVRDGRYELANRLARQRLAISDSPAARRVLAALPPDLGE